MSVCPPFSLITRIDMINSFPPDYMHLVCSSVMKRMLSIRCTSPVESDLRLNLTPRKQLSDHIVGIHGYTPFQFQSECQPLEDSPSWKASELRQFMFYIGPVVSKDILDPRLYDNSMELALSIYLLSHPSFFYDYIDYLFSLLQYCVY